MRNRETKRQDVVDRYWAHTFTGLEPPACCHIEEAYLEITVRNGGSANYDNESLLVGFIGDAGDSWAFSTPLSDWMALGDEETILLDLSDVYNDGTTNLLGIIESEGFLDVAVQDDSTVDCAVLHIIYGQ